MLNLERVTDGLVAGEDGIWYSPQARSVSYPAEGSEKSFEIEEQSFWFAHRNACITALIDAFPPPDGGPVFDIGGGNGFVAKAILDSGRDVVLVEPAVAGARNARGRGLPTVICASLESAGFAPHSLSAAGLFDVLEHIEDDVAFLNNLHRLIKPSGRLYLTVPAYKALWSDHDRLAGHFRRYTCEALAETVEAAGFSVDHATYFFRPLPIPIFLLRSLPQRLGLWKPASAAEGAVGDHKGGNATARRILAAALAPEIGNIRRRQPMRFGGSCLVAASKR